MNLPDLKQYRSGFVSKGLSLPLPVVSFEKDGLLPLLPGPSAGKTGWPWTEQTNPSVYDPTIQWPKITIVTPSYNQGRFIEETIRAVLLQNYPNLEYIIIDGGSTDNTVEVIEKYSPWISFWQNEKDRGQSHAINLGFSLASGDYYAWINSDDFYLKDVFYKVVHQFLKRKTDFIYGYAYDLKSHGSEQELLKMLPVLDYFIRIPTLVQPSCFWRAGIHQPIWEELHCSLDYELWLRLVQGKKRTRIKEPLSVARTHEDAKTYDPKMKARWDEDHGKICSAEGHGSVVDWKRRIFLFRVRRKIYNLFNLQ
jgi:glycosyltransferase involved in cell wall biosynthesis